MVDQATIRAAAAKLAALDFTVENAEIERLKAEIEQCTEAEQRGDDRRRQISQELASDDVGPQGYEVAKQLLAGDTNLAPLGTSRENLMKESEALGRGIRDLMKRSRDASHQIDGIRTRVQRQMRDATRELVIVLAREAEEAARRIMDCHVALRAIEVATGGKTPEHWAVEAAAEGLTGTATHKGLLSHGNVPVPAEIADLLAATKNMGAAVKPALITQVKV